MIDLGKDMSIDEFGTSLLSRAQQNARRQRRRDRRSDRNAILALLGGQLVGGVLKNSFDKKYEDFLNSETELKRTAQIKSAITQNNAVLEQERASLQYAGGQKKWLLNEIYQQNRAALDMQYYGQAPRDAKTLDQLAMTEAKKSLDEEFDLFNARIQAAKEFSSVAGSDMTRYTNALAANAKKERQIGSQLKRRFASFFRDEQDSDVDGALYKSATTEKIYEASQTYKDNFDTAYRVAGNARAAQRIAQALEDRKDPIPLSKGKFESASVYDPVLEKTIDMMVSFKADGSYNYVIDPNSGDVMSWESYKGQSRSGRTATDTDGKRLTEVLNVTDSDTAQKVREIASQNLPTDPTDSQRKMRFNVVGKGISETQRAMNNAYGSTVTAPRLASIAARSHILDRAAFEKRATLINGQEPENPLITLKAAADEFGGYNEIPLEFRDQIENRAKDYIDGLYTSIGQNLEDKPSLERLREVRQFTKSIHDFGLFDVVSDDILNKSKTLRFKLGERTYDTTGFLDLMIENYGDS
jgi:hypothetical protein